jgi:hypothetical protein
VTVLPWRPLTRNDRPCVIASPVIDPDPTWVVTIDGLLHMPVPIAGELYRL